MFVEISSLVFSKIPDHPFYHRKYFLLLLVHATGPRWDIVNFNILSQSFHYLISAVRIIRQVTIFNIFDFLSHAFGCHYLTLGAMIDGG